MPRFQAQGADVHYEDRGSGRPVVLLPGWGGSISELGSLADALLARGYRVVAVDLPGSGESGPRPRTYTSSYYGDDASLLLDMLASIDALPAHIAGFSDGGEYALLMAAQQPESVEAIVTWGAAGTLGSDTTMASLMADVIDSPAPPLRDFSDFMKSMYGEDNARIMTKSAAAAFAEIISMGGDISRLRASEISCPALLVTGEHDMFAPPDAVAEMAGAMPNARFHRVDGAGHAIHDESPAWLVQTVVDWFSTH